VKEYDSNILDALPKGAHLIVCQPGRTIYRKSIDPDYAALIAASVIAEDAITKAIVDAQKLKPNKQPITEEQKSLWIALANSFDQESFPLVQSCAADVGRAAVNAMIVEAEKLMQYEAVRKAYEQFIITAKLCANLEKESE
jgi:hypothetical protein